MSNPVQPIRPAATVIIALEAKIEFEIFMLKGTSSASFASGMFVFSGGRVDYDDHLHKYDEHRIGPTDARQFQIRSVGYEWRRFWIAAIQETFEESGLLLAFDQHGGIISFKEANSERRFSSYGQPLHDGQIAFLMFVNLREIN